MKISDIKHRLMSIQADDMASLRDCVLALLEIVDGHDSDIRAVRSDAYRIENSEETVDLSGISPEEL